MSHCSLCGAGLPNTRSLHQAEIAVCKTCGTAVIELSTASRAHAARRTLTPPLKRYRRRSVFSRLWAFN